MDMRSTILQKGREKKSQVSFRPWMNFDSADGAYKLLGKPQKTAPHLSAVMIASSYFVLLYFTYLVDYARCLF